MTDSAEDYHVLQQVLWCVLDAYSPGCAKNVLTDSELIQGRKD